MQIKTSDGEKSVASAGVGGTGLGLGIAGTALGLLNNSNNGGGILGGLFGCGSNQNVVSSLQANIARLESEKYTDKVGIDLYREIVATSNKNDEKINANYKELAQFVAALDKQIAVDKQATLDNFAFLNNRIDTTKNEVLCYCNSTFVPGKLVMPLSSLCPEAMARYNTWTAPTGTTTTPAEGA